MFAFDNWVLTSNLRVLPAYQFDNKTVTLTVEGDFPEGWDWAMKIRAGENWDILSMTWSDTGLTYELEKSQLSQCGVYDFQLRATQGELVKHTNIVSLYVPHSLPDGDIIWPTLPTEFMDMEQRIRASLQGISATEAEIREMSTHPPVPGENGFWLLWDAEKDEYAESELPLPEGTPPLMMVSVAGDDDGNLRASHTPEEMFAHAERGGMFVMVLSGLIAHPLFMGVDSDGCCVVFQAVICLGTGLTVSMSAFVHPDGLVELDEYVSENVQSVNGKSGTEIILDAKDVDALSQGELQNGVNLALAQAKASGVFKGDPGEPGPAGSAGKDGEPGKDGADGQPGKDGVSVTHSWSGTTLTITSASGSSSANLKGEPGKDGERGPAGPAGADGQAGKDGADGKDNLPNIVSLSGAAVTLTMDHNVEYHCTDAVTALTINGFTPAEDGKASIWAMQFTAGSTITVTLPDSVKWAVAEPVFVPNVSYWLTFVPLISGGYLGVWVSDES